MPYAVWHDALKRRTDARAACYALSGTAAAHEGAREPNRTRKKSHAPLRRLCFATRIQSVRHGAAASGALFAAGRANMPRYADGLVTP